ncbi:MAG: S8 family serine peptidase [candidate division WOR-3 bacterium]
MFKFLLIIWGLTPPYLPFEGKITPSLREKLNYLSKNDRIHVVVHLSDIYPYDEITALSTEEKVRFFKEYAKNSQSKVIKWLEDNFKGEYEILMKNFAYNGFHMEATKKVIYALEKNDDIWFIDENREVKIIYTKTEKDNTYPAAIEWNVSKVKADSCWYAGYNGQDVIIGHIDTGVEVSHPALSGKWVTGYWFDGVNGNPNPYDDNGHGTHTMGTILGGDGVGPFTEDIGVAPGARFVTAKAFNSSGSGSYATIDPCMDSMVSWKGRVDIRAVSNSWGTTNYTDLHWWGVVYTWLTLGILPVFAAGNEGFSGLRAPGSYPHTLAVGATDINDNIASFSSRGPAPNQSPFNDTTYWLRNDWNFIKPQISAPGVNIRSSVPGGGYQGGWNGTSMATPHVAGAVAIIVQKNNLLTPKQIYSLIIDYPDKPTQGSPYPNNNYGWGRLNIWKALQNTPSPNRPFILFSRYRVDDANGNGNGIFDPGETVNLFITLRNIGINATNVNAVLKTSDSYVSVLDSTALYPDMPTESSKVNIDPFVVTSSPSTPLGYQAPMVLKINSNDSIYDFRNFNLKVGLIPVLYGNHDVGEILLTVTALGAIGFTNSNQNEGSGLHYPKNSQNYLKIGSIWAGNSNSYVLNTDYSADNADWMYLPNGLLQIGATKYSDQDASARYDDSGHPNSRGVEVHQESFAWALPPYNDFIIFKYTIKNNWNYNLIDFYSGMFLDIDISPNSDTGGRDLGRKAIYLSNGNPTHNKCLGIVLLEPQNPRNITFIQNSVYVDPNGYITDAYKFQFLKGLIGIPNTYQKDNWSTLISAGSFTIPSGDSIVLAFAVVAGDSLFDFQGNADTARDVWNGLGIREKPVSFIYSNSPYIISTFGLKNNELKLFVPYSGKYYVSIYNPTGRRLGNTFKFYEKEGIYTLSLSEIISKSNKLSKGTYFIKLSSDSRDFLGKFIIFK